MSSGKYAGLAKMLQKTEWSGDEVLSLCPFHQDSSPSFRFNVRKGLFVCFACAEKGTAAKLAKRLGATLSDDVSLSNLRAAMDELNTPREEIRVKDERSLSRYMGPPHVYWRRRGFSNRTIKRWCLGYDPLEEVLTIPYRNEYGELLGVFFRRTKDNVYPRYLYPKGFPRKRLLYGAEKIAGVETVALVEGSTDAIWCDQNGIPAVSQLGSSLSDEQVDILRRSGVRNVILLHDYDLAGRKASFEAWRKLTDFVRITPSWDEEKYCWHEWLCGCSKKGKPGHVPLKAHACPNRQPCRCGKEHGADPGSLKANELHDLVPEKFRLADAQRFVKELRQHDTKIFRRNTGKN